MRTEAGSTAGFSPAGPPATSDSMRNDDDGINFAGEHQDVHDFLRIQLIGGLVAIRMAEDHRDRSAFSGLEVGLFAVPGRTVPIAFVIHP